jgi:hypothetical protein
MPTPAACSTPSSAVRRWWFSPAMSVRARRNSRRPSATRSRARRDIDITLLPLSLSSRGQGRVGEMTQLVSTAFEHAFNEASKFKSEKGAARGGVILLVDEADALAQSRESDQMHHEDRAGVNAFIRGIDRFSEWRTPRRGADVHQPTERSGPGRASASSRHPRVRATQMPSNGMKSSRVAWGAPGFGKADLQALVAATGEQPKRAYGFTYSDITQRLLPAIVLDAYPDGPIKPSRAIELARSILPTPPFRDTINPVTIYGTANPSDKEST